MDTYRICTIMQEHKIATNNYSHLFPTDRLPRPLGVGLSNDVM